MQEIRIVTSTGLGIIGPSDPPIPAKLGGRSASTTGVRIMYNMLLTIKQINKTSSTFTMISVRMKQTA